MSNKSNHISGRGLVIRLPLITREDNEHWKIIKRRKDIKCLIISMAKMIQNEKVSNDINQLNLTSEVSF